MYMKPLEQALEMLQKEDPSLKVNIDAETGQTIIAGMGELHLEIILERIRSDFKVDASMGPFQVAYKETIVKDICDTYILDKFLGIVILSLKSSVHPIINEVRILLAAGTKHYVKLIMSINSDLTAEGTPEMTLSNDRDSRDQLAKVWAIHLKAAQKGVESALTSGPLLSFPVRDLLFF